MWYHTRMSAPVQLDEAKLIDELRRKVRPGMSVRKAAAAAEISEGRWRQIIKGYNQVDKQTSVPVRAPASTLARMARAVGATPDQLREVGRDDAADEMAVLPIKSTAEDASRNGGAVHRGAAGSDVGVEFAAMERVAAAIEDLDQEGRRRVLRWALDRYAGGPTV